ncbi:EscC/YscC/HrcC family type III secretion system outer membrane ring protein [Opitutaceae bacterium EW11]|nr:EscC/YscC/HrcC family type III secretion system outer membrane ring protein [Opitutaceae bacterium EW11]
MNLPLRTALAFLASAVAGFAAQNEIPWRHDSVSLRADRQPAGQLLKSFAADQGIPLQLTDRATSSVSGEFQGLRPRAFLDALCEASELVWFWDGSRLHVDAASELQTRVVNVEAISPTQAVSAFQALGFDSGPAGRGISLRGTGGVITLSGGPRFLEIAEPLLRTLDLQEKDRRAAADAKAAQDEEAARARDNRVEVRVFRLKFASASDIVVQGGTSQSTVPGVARALQNLMGSQSGELSTGVALQERRRQLTGLRGLGLAAIGRETEPEEKRAPGAGGNDSPTEPDDKRPLIQADPRLNAVVVRDIAARMPLYQSLIEQLDVSSPVIEISAAVVDIDADNGKSLGVEFLTLGDGHGSTKVRGGFEADRAYNTADGSNTGQTPAFTDGPDLVRGPGALTSVLVPVGGYQLLTRIRALEEKGDAQLVTSPSVITLENIEANLQQQETVYIRVAGRENADLFDVHAGVQLRVTPTVVRDGDQVTFRLIVGVQDGSFSTRTVDGVPSTTQSAINTQAVVPADKTLLIGGYFVERQENNTRQVPGLGNIPVLGRLFKRTQNSHSRAQRFYFITPRLVDVQKEARLNRPAVEPAKSPLPPQVIQPETVTQTAHDLAGRGLPVAAAITAKP